MSSRDVLQCNLVVSGFGQDGERMGSGELWDLVVQGHGYLHHQGVGGHVTAAGRSHCHDTEHVFLTLQKTVWRPDQQLGEQTQNYTGIVTFVLVWPYCDTCNIYMHITQCLGWNFNLNVHEVMIIIPCATTSHSDIVQYISACIQHVNFHMVLFTFHYPSSPSTNGSSSYLAGCTGKMSSPEIRWYKSWKSIFMMKISHKFQKPLLFGDDRF